MAMTERHLYRWALVSVALLSLSGSGCVQIKHALHWHTPVGHSHHSPWYHCPDCGRILADPHHQCDEPYYIEYPYFGYSATCWRPWPAGWVGCPIQIEEYEVIEGTYVPEGEMDPMPVAPPPTPPMPRNQEAPSRESRRPQLGPLAQRPTVAVDKVATTQETPIIIMAVRTPEIVGLTMAQSAPQTGSQPEKAAPPEQVVTSESSHWPMVAAVAPQMAEGKAGMMVPTPAIPPTAQPVEVAAATPQAAPARQPVPVAKMEPLVRRVAKHLTPVLEKTEAVPIVVEAEQPQVATAVAESPLEQPEPAAEDRTGDKSRGLKPVQIRLVSGAEETP